MSMVNFMAVRKRLEAEGSKKIRFVKGAADFASALKEGVKQTPVQFVIPGSFKDAPNVFGTELIAQERNFDFSVVTVISSLRDARGEAAQDEMNALLEPTHKALVGWQPAPDFDPIEANGGQLWRFHDGQVWWQSRFKTKCENRSND